MSDISVNLVGVKATGYGILLGGTRQGEPIDEGAPTFFWLVCADGRTILGEQNPFCGTIEEIFDVAMSLAPGQYYEVEETEEVFEEGEDAKVNRESKKQGNSSKASL